MALESLPLIGGVASTLLGNSAARELQGQQRAWDYKMWQENNRYNSPVEQVKRLRSAGLNPALAMSQGLMSSGLSSETAGGQQPPRYDFSPISQALMSSVDVFLSKRKQDAEINNLNEQTTNQAIRNRYENQRQIIEIDKMLHDMRLSRSQREYYIAERDRLVKENKWIDKRNSTNIALNDAETQRVHEQAETERVMRDVNQRVADQQIRLSKSQQALLSAEVKQIKESVNQMILNGASQREVNKFISDRERETARKLFKDNESYAERFLNEMNESKSRTQANRRQVKQKDRLTIFGIPFGTGQDIILYDENGNELPQKFGYLY